MFRYVKPRYNNRIRPLISRLTGITCYGDKYSFDEAMNVFKLGAGCE